LTQVSARAAAVDELERRIGHTFGDRDLLERALTHASVGMGARKVRDNERLEFLGDRVLGLLAADALMRRLPEASEGDLSKRLHALVRFETCARVAGRVALAPALRLSAGESKTGGRSKDKVLGDACEALLAAVYLDAGLEVARALFDRLWDEELAVLETTLDAQDSKSALQRWALAKGRGLPQYDIVERTGPDHAPLFRVAVMVEGMDPVQAAGGSRQDAEKAAALALLAREGQL
jgi:ribonuclease-3